MIYWVILFCIVYLYLAWRKLDWAVMLIIAALPSYLIRFQIFSIPFTLLEAMILIAFFVWLIKNYKQIILNIKNRTTLLLNPKSEILNQKCIPYPFGIELILVLVVSYIAVFIAGLTNDALGIWKAYFFEPALFFILVLNVFRYKAPAVAKAMAGKNDAKTPPTPLYQGGRSRTLQMDVLEKIILSLAVGAVAVSILAIYQKITGNLIGNPLWAAAATRRVVSFFGYPNAVGLYLGPIVIVLVGYFSSLITNNQISITKKNPNHNNQTSSPDGEKFGIWNLEFFWLLIIGNCNFKTIFILLTIILSMLAIIFAKSVGALLGLGAALFVFGLLVGKKLRWATILVAAVMIIGIMAVPTVRTKVANKILFQDLSGQIRLQQWRETWQMMTGSPTRFIFGTGLSGYQKAIAPYHQEGIFFNSEHEPFEEFHRKTVFNAEYKAAHWQPVEIYMYPHNILLNYWTELGLAGAILFIWIIYKCFRLLISNFQFPISKQISNFKYLNIGLLTAMIVIVIHGIVDVPYFKNDLSVLFWLLVAMACLLNISIIKNKLCFYRQK